jgi:hypothetical protein
MSVRPSRLFALAFAGFFLMIAAWSVAVPYDGTPDEHDHVYRAIGVVSGDITPEPTAAVRGSGAFQTIPAGFRATGCWLPYPELTPADCAGGDPSADRTPVRIGSGAGRYQPVYYAIVGLPLKLWPGWSGLILARLISGALAAALLAAALTVIVRYTRGRLMMIGLVAGVTPMVTYFAGSINPNGLEIAAGVAFFAAMVPLFLEPPERISPTLVRLAGIGALWLATLRSMGLVFLFFAVISFALPPKAGNLRAVWRIREARWWAAGVAAAAAASLVWIVVMKAGDLGDFRTGHYSPSQAVFAVVERWPNLFKQMVGMTSWLYFVFMPAPAYVVWLLLAGVVIVMALLFGNRLDRWRLAGLITGGLLAPTAIQIAFMNRTGFITQGRYLLPGLVGVLLLAGYVLERRGLGRDRAVSLTRLVVVALLPIHLLCLIVAMARWQRGVPEDGRIGASTLNPFGGRWEPPLTSVTPLLLQVAGLAIIGWLVWTAHRVRLVGVAEPTPATSDTDAADDLPADGRNVGAQRDGTTGTAPDTQPPAGDTPVRATSGTSP